MSHTGSPPINQDIFLRSDASQTGTLSLNKLRNAVMATGRRPYSFMSLCDPFHFMGPSCSGALTGLIKPFLEGSGYKRRSNTTQTNNLLRIIDREQREIGHSLFWHSSNGWCCGIVKIPRGGVEKQFRQLRQLRQKNTEKHILAWVACFLSVASWCGFLNSDYRKEDEWRHAEFDGCALWFHIWSHNTRELYRSDPSLWVHEPWVHLSMREIGASKLKATIIHINEYAKLMYVLITDFYGVHNN